MKVVAGSTMSTLTMSTHSIALLRTMTLMRISA
jgi:hypothetical protein